MTTFIKKEFFSNTDFKELSDLLESKYNIISRIEFLNFDQDYSILKNWLEKNSKDMFDVNDRFLVMHFDTDYYIKDYGLILHNFFNLWKQYDIPLFTMIFCTNHHGITNEIYDICKFDDQKPFIIETCLNQLLYPSGKIKKTEIDINNIEKHALCLSGGTSRSHRSALFNQLKELQPEKIAYSIKRNIK